MREWLAAGTAGIEAHEPFCAFDLEVFHCRTNAYRVVRFETLVKREQDSADRPGI